MKLHSVSSNLASVSLVIASIVGISSLSFVPQATTPAIAQTTGEAGDPVTTKSTPKAIALAKHLRKIGVKVYTAYWCPHCHAQKQRFGKEAVSQLEVIECDQRGINPQRQLCIDKKIRGFPTWEINGRFYPGNQSLENLAKLSKYKGDI